MIRSQEELLKMAEKDAHINDIISEVKALISNSVNSGISDFSSAFGNTKENNQSKCGFNFRKAPIVNLESGQDNLSGLVFRSCRLDGDNAGTLDAPFAQRSAGKERLRQRTFLLDAFDLSQLSLLMMSTALCLNNPGGSLHQLKLPSSNRELDALLSRCAIVYESEQPNLGYFLQWFDRMYRSKYRHAGKRKNHLEKLSLISNFRQKLDDLSQEKDRVDRV